MKRKYKIQILIVILIVCGIWGMVAGVFFVNKYIENLAMGIVLISAGTLISLLIPIRMIANKAKNEV